MAVKDLSSFSFLVVDDVRTTRIGLLGILKELGNPMVFHAENGHEAVSMLQDKAQGVNCIISDFNMPVMHGLRMVQLIRTGHGKIRRDIPVIMLTGYGDRNLLGVALALDVNAFLVKPAKKTILFERIMKLLDVVNKEDQWIKPVESYKCIDTDTMIQDILEKPSVDIKPDRVPDRVAQVIEDQQKKTAFKRASTIDTSPAAYGVPPMASAGARGPKSGEGGEEGEIKAAGVCYRLETVPANSILARDLKGMKGKKLLSANMKITVGMIDRLKDLKALGEPIEEIWVVPGKPGK